MKKFLCILIIATFLGSSFSIFTVGSITFYAFRVLFVLFVLCHLIKGTKLYKYPFMSKYQIILIAFALFTVFTLLQTPGMTHWLDGCVFLIINVCLIYFIYYYTDTDQDINQYVFSFMIGLLMTILIAIYEYKTGNHIIANNYLSPYSTMDWQYSALSKYPTGFLYNPNNIGVAMLIGLSFGTIFLKKEKFKDGILFTVWTALCIYVALSTGSRGAIVFIFIALLMSIITLSQRSDKKLFGVLVLIGIGIIAYNVFNDIIWLQLERSGLLIAKLGQSADDDGRWQLIRYAFDAALNSWFMGTGPKTAEVILRENYGLINSSVHNFWMEMLLTEGIGGTLCFIAFYFRCIKVQWKLRKEYKASNSVLVALLMFSIACVIPPTVITLHFIWLIFGFSLAIEKLYYLQTEKVI